MYEENVDFVMSQRFPGKEDLNVNYRELDEIDEKSEFKDGNGNVEWECFWCFNE